VWAGADGPLTFELTAPAEFADWSAAAENLASQLTAFGINTTFRGVQFQQQNEDVQQGKFTLAINAGAQATRTPSSRMKETCCCSTRHSRLGRA
jgi:peptide/nickel transport system substrate-binding protein